MTEQQEAVLRSIENKQYDLALAAIERLTLDERKHGRILIAKADAQYELGKDVEALRSYVAYLDTYPDGRGLDFALFGMAMCLKNLDLQSEASAVLTLVAPDHVGLKKELDHSKEVLARQADARRIVASVLADSRRFGKCHNREARDAGGT